MERELAGGEIVETEKWVKTISGEIRPRHIDCVFSAWLALLFPVPQCLCLIRNWRDLWVRGTGRGGMEMDPAPWKLESDKNKTSKKVALSSASENSWLEADARSVTTSILATRPLGWQSHECHLVPSEVNYLASSGACLPTLMALLISDASYKGAIQHRTRALMIWAKQSERETDLGQPQPPAGLVIMS